MFKGLIKNLLAVSMMTLPLTGFLAGTQMYLKSADKSEKTMENFLEKYTLSDEYKAIKEEIQNNYSQQLEAGKMSPVVYAEKVEELYSKSVTEDLIVKYGSEQTISELNKVNEAIEKLKNEKKAGIIIATISSTLAAPLAIKGMNICTMIDNEKLKNTDDESYLEKPVIV